MVISILGGKYKSNEFFQALRNIANYICFSVTLFAGMYTEMKTQVYRPPKKGRFILMASKQWKFLYVMMKNLKSNRKAKLFCYPNEFIVKNTAFPIFKKFLFLFDLSMKYTLVWYELKLKRYLAYSIR